MTVIGPRLPRQPGATLIWLISTLTALAFVVGCSNDTTADESTGSTDAAPQELSPDETDAPPTSANGAQPDASRDRSPDPDASTAEQDRNVTRPSQTRPEDCPPSTNPSPPEGPAAAVTVLNPGEGGQARVEAVIYPRPAYDGNPWSHWGQGLVLDDGRFFSAIGDHYGADGNSYFFSYDPDTSTLTRFGDVLSSVGHRSGAWGYGKVHGQLVADPCGKVWAATYWGSRRGLTFDAGYEGDLLLRIDPATHRIEEAITPVPRYGIPSLAGSAEHGLLYGEAVEPESDEGRFFAVDMMSGELVVEDEVDDHTGYRNILVDADGVAHIAVANGRLAAYRPGAEQLEDAGVALPGDWLRASTEPASDGTVYAVTRGPDQLFALTADGSTRDLGPARGYVASLALLPGGDGFLYVPGAHGDSWKQGTPLVAVDGATGDQQVVVELHDMGRRAFDLRFGGTYSVAVDPQRRVVYIQMNAGEAGEESFGEVVLVIVHLP